MKEEGVYDRNQYVTESYTAPLIRLLPYCETILSHINLFLSCYLIISFIKIIFICGHNIDFLKDGV